MNLTKLLLVTTILLFNYSFLSAQNCSKNIIENKKISGTHFLKTFTHTLVVRGNYSYSLQLMNDQKGLTAKFVSKNGVDLNEGDEVVFMDNSRTRKSYRFIGMGEISKQRGDNPPSQSNSLELDLAAISWFASHTINTIYIKNNISNRMAKFTINASRQKKFKAMATCFDITLDKSKVNDVALSGNNFKPSGKSGSVSNTGRHHDSKTGKSKIRNVADISLLNDKELAELRKELVETKERIRVEIQTEKEKGERIKQKLQEEVTTAREQAAKKKIRICE